MNLSRDEVSFDLDEVFCNVCDIQMAWSDETREWICPNCGNRAFQDWSCGPDEIYYEHGPSDDYSEYYDEDEEPEEYYDPEDYDMPDGDY